MVEDGEGVGPEYLEYIDVALAIALHLGPRCANGWLEERFQERFEDGTISWIKIFQVCNILIYFTTSNYFF